ncbi:MAG: hypothetical protein LASZOEIN_002785, partial [Candidatus Fervidibacter sp.]
MKRLIGRLLGLALCFGLLGFALSAPAFKTKKQGEKVVIAGIGKSIHAYWREVELGM